jgi:hypothetical protein
LERRSDEQGSEFKLLARSYGTLITQVTAQQYRLPNGDLLMVVQSIAPGALNCARGVRDMLPTNLLQLIKCFQRFDSHAVEHLSQLSLALSDEGDGHPRFRVGFACIEPFGG